MALDTPSRPDSGAAHGDRGGPANRIGRALLAPELFPALAALVVLIFWATKQGGIAPTSWYPGALFLLGVLIVTVYAYRAYLPGLPTGVIVAAGLLAACVPWKYLSISWADVQGAAL